MSSPGFAWRLPSPDWSLGLAAAAAGKAALAWGLWTAGVLPVIGMLFVAIVHELLAGRLGVDAIEVSVDRLAVGDAVLVRGGEIVPVDGVVRGSKAVLDEAALTGEPIPVERGPGEVVHSGTLNAGEAFELTATATAGASTYAGIVRMVVEAQAGKAPVHPYGGPLWAPLAAGHAHAGGGGLAVLG